MFWTSMVRFLVNKRGITQILHINLQEEKIYILSKGSRE